MDAHPGTSLDHIPKLPRFIFWVRIAQAFVALIALALAASSLALFGASFLSGHLGFLIFVCIATWIVVAYLCCTPIYGPSLYNRWAALGLEIFCVIFWLPAFASVGAWTSVHGLYTWDSYDCEIYGTCRYQTGWRTAAAAAGMGGLEFILFLVTLITYSIFLHRHRMQGASTSNGYEGGAPPAPVTTQPPVNMQNLGYAPKEQVAYNQQPVYPN